MKKWGLTLLFIGIFSFILPLLGLQFRILNIFGGRQEGSFIFIGAGVILYLASLRKGRRPPEREPSPQPPLKRAEGEGQEVSCSACGGKNSPGDLFCGTCGIALTSDTPPSTQTCGHCGASISAEELFCGGCGRPVSEKQGPAKVLLAARAPNCSPASTQCAFASKRCARSGMFGLRREKCAKGFVLRHVRCHADLRYAARHSNL